MRRLILLPALLLVLTPARHAQHGSPSPADGDDVALSKLLLLNDLRALEAAAAKLDAPLARARAKAEIADAAWRLDEAWAKELLEDSYRLTFPEEEDRARLRDKPVGAAPTPPTAIDRARGEVRNRVLQVAGRDRLFADELIRFGARELGRQEENHSYSVLASQTLRGGDAKAAGEYAARAFEADPTLIAAASVVVEIAAKDRALADRLIVQYIERLRDVPLSTHNQSALRVFFALNQLVFNLDFRQPRGPVAPPGPAVMKAYAAYMIESLGELERAEPGYLRRGRPVLLSLWPTLRQHAPELVPEFFALEQLSRGAGEDAPLPTRASLDEAARARYEARLKSGLEGRPDETSIYSAMSRSDFDKARKLIDKLEDEPQRKQLAEIVNAREALALAAANDTGAARRLAERLTNAASILQVYPAIVEKCAARKDQACAISAVHQAMAQLKRADTSLPLPPAGIPASAVATAREIDPVLASLAALAQSVADSDVTLAMEVLDEAVVAANRSETDTGLGRAGVEASLFRTLAERNEPRARQAAEGLKDPLRQIVALAGILQWKAHESAGREQDRDRPLLRPGSRRTERIQGRDRAKPDRD